MLVAYGKTAESKRMEPVGVGTVPKTGSPNHKWGFNVHGVTVQDCMSREDLQGLGADIVRGKEVQTILRKHYPGHPWVIEFNHRQKIIQIWIKHLHEWPFVVKTWDFYADPARRCIVRAGGEFLERFNIPRAGFSETDFYTAVNLMKLPMYKKIAPPEDLRSERQQQDKVVKELRAQILRADGQPMSRYRRA